MEVEVKVEAEADMTRGNAITSGYEHSGGGKDGCIRWCMMRGQDDKSERHANKVEGLRIGDN